MIHTKNIETKHIKQAKQKLLSVLILVWYSWVYERSKNHLHDNDDRKREKQRQNIHSIWFCIMTVLSYLYIDTCHTIVNASQPNGLRKTTEARSERYESFERARERVTETEKAEGREKLCERRLCVSVFDWLQWQNTKETTKSKDDIKTVELKQNSTLGKQFVAYTQTRKWEMNPQAIRWVFNDV